MKRPDGPLRIARTELLADRVIVADLAGRSHASVAAVRRGGRFYFVAPGGLAGSGNDPRLVIRETPACSLTDCMNSSVDDLGARHPKNRKSARRKT